MSRLKKYYQDTINGEMRTKFGYKNVLEVPRVEKIVINCGFGELGKVGIDFEIVSVRSIGFTPIDINSN